MTHPVDPDARGRSQDPDAPAPGGTVPAGGDQGASAGSRPRPGRPVLERIGLAAIALVLVGLFGIVAVAAFAGGELFLAAMGALGALMTLWVGAMTLLRG